MSSSACGPERAEPRGFARRQPLFLLAFFGAYFFEQFGQMDNWERKPVSVILGWLMQFFVGCEPVRIFLHAHDNTRRHGKAAGPTTNERVACFVPARQFLPGAHRPSLSFVFRANIDLLTQV